MATLSPVTGSDAAHRPSGIATPKITAFSVPHMSTAPTTIDHLRSIELFADTSDEILSQIADVSQEVTYEPRTTIFSENSVAQNVYFVLDGEVSLVICTPKSGCRQLDRAGKGELVGWSPLLEKTRFSAAAHATTAVKAIEIDGQKLLGICEQNPAFGFQLIRKIAEVVSDRLRAMRLKLLDQCGIHLPEVNIESD